MNNIKLIIIIISFVLLLWGLITGDTLLEISGAFTFLIPYFFELPIEYKEAKLYRTGKWQPIETKSIFEIIELRIRQAIIIFGLLLSVSKHTSGTIIFGGAIVFYFISGLIAKEVAGIPLEMGYGGWRKRNTRRRH